MPGGLLTDLYELRMAASYLRRGMNEPATFSLFVRKLPPARGFLVAAGLEDCLRFLAGFGFDDEDLGYLERECGLDAATARLLRGLTFEGDVWAVPEGRIVHAGEPLLEVTAPIPEAQIVETYLLNQITFQTTLASKAARCRIAAAGVQLVDFSFRRDHGVEAAMAVARLTAMAGFAATSNVEAARRFGLRASGTMAHSYIEAFPDEAEAFRAFARDFPGLTTFLVDTYDTPNGVRTAISVIRELGLTEGVAVRLDSGDLAALARDTRRMLDEAGLGYVRIFASGGLDELEINDLVRDGVPIDAFGVGTRIGVSYDAPALDSAYKLVEYAGRPVVKLSAQKATAPGAKQVYRSLRGDVIALRDETAPAGAEPLLEQVMASGRRVGPAPTLDECRHRFEADLERLPEDARDLRAPRPVDVRFSSRLSELTADVGAAARRRVFGES